VDFNAYREEGMGVFKISGTGLYNSHRHLIAKSKGESIFDADNQRIGVIRGNNLFDCGDRKMMTVRGAGIYDSDNNKIGTIPEVMKAIEGGIEEVMCAALWYCFIR
jgi:hypothetical protein